jgi:hypothetical protein
MKIPMGIVDFIDQKKYGKALDNIQVTQSTDEFSHSEIIFFYDKIIAGLKNKSELKYSESINQYIDYLQSKEDYSNLLKQTKKISSTKRNLEIELISYEKIGNLEKLKEKHIEYCEYLRVKTLYNEINLFLKAVNYQDINIQLIGLINAFNQLDVKACFYYFEAIKEHYLKENLVNKDNQYLLTELLKRIETTYGSNADLDYIVDTIGLFKRYQEILAGSKLKKEDIELIISILILKDDIEITKFIIKTLYESNKKIIALDLSRYLEKKKEFNYFRDVKNDLTLRKIFVDLRQFQTGIKKIDNYFNFDQKTREFQFSSPVAPQEEKTDVSEIIEKYNSNPDIYKSMQSDIIGQIKYGGFDHYETLDDILISLSMLNLDEVNDALINKYPEKINSYIIASHYFDKKSYYECINICDGKIIDKKLNIDEYNAFIYLKALALLKQNKNTQAVRILEIIYRDSPKYRMVEKLINENKSS